MKNRLLLAVLVAGAIGCGQGERPCPPYPGVGLVLTVLNDQTNDPICDAVVTAQPANGGASWRLPVNTACEYMGAFGTVLVHAERAKFTPASQVVEVRNSGGECSIALETHAAIRLTPEDEMTHAPDGTAEGNPNGSDTGGAAQQGDEADEGR